MRSVARTLLLALCAAFAAGSCVTYKCPSDLLPKLDAENLICPVQRVDGKCVQNVNVNTAQCCSPGRMASLSHLADDYTPVVIVNLVGIIPLGLTIFLAVWGTRRMNHDEKESVERHNRVLEELDQAERENMQGDTMWFVTNERRKSISATPRPEVASAVGEDDESVSGSLIDVFLDASRLPLGWELDDNIVRKVEKGGAAHRAGIKAGAVIKAVEGEETAPREVGGVLEQRLPTCTLTVKMPASFADDDVRLIRVPVHGGQFETSGTTITKVITQPAHFVLQPGMTILAVNGTPVNDRSIVKALAIVKDREVFHVDIEHPGNVV